MVVFDSAISEGPQLYSQICHLTISNGTLKEVFESSFCLKVRFSAAMIVLL